jgi:hypothetical protein
VAIRLKGLEEKDRPVTMVDPFQGVLAQLVERNHGMVEVTGSIPVHSNV